MSILAQKDLTQLAIDVAKAKKTAPVNYSLNGVEAHYSYEDMQGALREQFRGLAGDYYSYQRNSLTIFEIMKTVIDAVLPAKVIDAMGQFAEVIQLKQGQKAQFTVKAGRLRAKGFITKVSPAGVYETFRLDRTSKEIPTFAYGGSAQIGLEEFLDGTIDFNELLEIVQEGLEDAIYTEVQLALVNSLSNVPTANQHSTNSFDAVEMTKLVNTVASYAGGVKNVSIICSPQFASAIVPATGFVSDVDRNDLRNQGYIGMFMGAKVVVLPQSFTDETNVNYLINPQFAYVVPTNADKIVKVVLEGETIVKESENADNSTEIKAFKKFGVGILSFNFYAIYKNTAIPATNA